MYAECCVWIRKYRVIKGNGIRRQTKNVVCTHARRCIEYSAVKCFEHTHKRTLCRYRIYIVGSARLLEMVDTRARSTSATVIWNCIDATPLWLPVVWRALIQQLLPFVSMVIARCPLVPHTPLPLHSSLLRLGVCVYRVTAADRYTYFAVLDFHYKNQLLPLHFVIAHSRHSARCVLSIFGCSKIISMYSCHRQRSTVNRCAAYYVALTK